MTVFHRLVGYDKATELVAAQVEIPAEHLDYAKQVAGVGPDDPDAVFCYELNPHKARDIGGAIGAALPSDDLDWFMEGSSEPVRSAA